MSPIKRNCVKCGDEYLGEYPEYCCSGSGCGCMGMEIYPPLCEMCEMEFYKPYENKEFGDV